MTAQQLRFIVPLCTVIALTCACSKPAADPASTSNAIDHLVATADSASAAASEAKPAGDALEPNQRVQGTIQLDIGNGAAAFRSIATKIPDDLGKTTAARLGSAAGQKDLASANAKVGGGHANVSAQDVQDMANSFAGRTMYTSEMNSLAIANLRIVGLSGVDANGRKTTLNIKFPMDSDTPSAANLEYVPDGKKRTQWFETDRKSDASVEVTLDRFERVDDKTLSIAGSFKANKLVPGVLSRELAGQEIPGASGSFDFTEVNIRPEK